MAALVKEKSTSAEQLAQRVEELTLTLAQREEEVKEVRNRLSEAEVREKELTDSFDQLSEIRGAMNSQMLELDKEKTEAVAARSGVYLYLHCFFALLFFKSK